MKIISSDGIKYVDIGSSDIWLALYSTIVACFGIKKITINKALSFFDKGECKSQDGFEVARQFNQIRDELSKHSPDKAVYDLNDKKNKPKWLTEISPVTTSCGNLFTTADGKDLLYEVVCILTYAEIAKVDIRIE